MVRKNRVILWLLCASEQIVDMLLQSTVSSGIIDSAHCVAPCVGFGAVSKWVSV